MLLACAGDRQENPTESLFMPPTVVNTPSPLPPATTTSLPITATPPCTDNLTYIEDISIPDGTVVGPGTELDKRWQVTNSGTCNWDREYKLVLISGPDLGAGDELALFPARSGTDVEIQVRLTAPEETGSVRSAWQAVNPEGEPFGDAVFIDIIVE
jgi:Ig-like domain from next to BRCA1 gene